MERGEMGCDPKARLNSIVASRSEALACIAHLHLGQSAHSMGSASFVEL